MTMMNYNDFKNDLWNRFVEYYNNNKKKSGDYKLENDECQLYQL
jgi:predicted PolB exonuclease-like 3'-5' exonuclease